MGMQVFLLDGFSISLVCVFDPGCLGETPESWGRELPWSVFLEAEPETGILGKRCIEGLLSGKTGEQGERDRVGEGAKEGQRFPQGALEHKGHHRFVPL